MKATDPRLSVLAIAIVASGCAATSPQQDQMMLDQARLEDRMQQLERKVDNQSLLEMSRKVTALEQELRDLRGAVESLQFEQQGLVNRQRDQYLDIDSRLQSLEGGRGSAAAGAAAGALVAGAGQASSASAPAPLQSGPAAASEQDAYNAAFNQLKDGRYEQAAAGFTQFLATYPKSNLSDNAQYWLAETFYVRRQFDKALEAFSLVSKDYPESRKMPDALLKIGYCNYELQRWSEAKAALGQVTQRFPDSTAARLASQRLDRIRTEGH